MSKALNPMSSKDSGTESRSDRARSERLYKQIGKFIGKENVNLEELTDLITESTSTIQADLKRERAKFAMALLPRAHRNIMKYLGRYEGVFDKALDEAERRAGNPDFLSNMSTRDLIKFLDLFSNRIGEISKIVGMTPMGEKKEAGVKIDARQAPFSRQDLANAFRQIAQAHSDQQIQDADYDEVSESPALERPSTDDELTVG